MSNGAEIAFFNALAKEAQLSEETIAALGVKQPEMLDQLEQQAVPQEQEQEQPQAEATPAQPQRMVRVKTEKEDIEVPYGFFKGTDAHPLKMVVLLKTKYGDDWVEWLPETLWETIRKDIGPISEVSQNKVQALAAALATDSPWQDWNIFENCGRAFNNTIPVFGEIQPLSPIETAFTIYVLKKLNNYSFSDDVLGYIASVCLYSGIIYAPRTFFSGVQSLIDKQNKRPELKAEIEAAWKIASKEDLLGVEFDIAKPVDVQIAKLWAVQEYLLEKAAQLKEK